VFLLLFELKHFCNVDYIFNSQYFHFLFLLRNYFLIYFNDN